MKELGAEINERMPLSICRIESSVLFLSWLSPFLFFFFRCAPFSIVEEDYIRMAIAANSPDACDKGTRSDKYQRSFKLRLKEWMRDSANGVAVVTRNDPPVDHTESLSILRPVPLFRSFDFRPGTAYVRFADGCFRLAGLRACSRRRFWHSEYGNRKKLVSYRNREMFRCSDVLAKRSSLNREHYRLSRDP